MKQYNFGEAFHLMWYRCRCCGHKERIWNSRDGITPATIGCPSCGQATLCHNQRIGNDEFAPDYKLHPNQKFWRDGTIEEAIEIVKERYTLSQNGKYPMFIDARDSMIGEISRGTDMSFEPGWPKLDIHKTKIKEKAHKPWNGLLRE